MELREFVEAEINANPVTEHALHLRHMLRRYDTEYPPAVPVTLATLPGELEKLGFVKDEDDDTHWVAGDITVDWGSLGVFVYHRNSCIKPDTNPADALELVKLLMKEAERG